MRAYNIQAGEYYVLRLGGRDEVGKVVAEVDRRDDLANYRYECEITEGPRRGEKVTVSSRRILAPASETSTNGNGTPSTGTLVARREQQVVAPKDPNPRKAATRLGMLDLHLKLTMPVADLPSVLALLEEYRPEVTKAQTTEE